MQDTSRSISRRLVLALSGTIMYSESYTRMSMTARAVQIHMHLSSPGRVCD
jgi:hypothetical protein